MCSILLCIILFKKRIGYSRGPQTLGHSRVPFCGLLGRTAGGEQSANYQKVHVYLQLIPIARIAI